MFPRTGVLNLFCARKVSGTCAFRKLSPNVIYNVSCDPGPPKGTQTGSEMGPKGALRDPRITPKPRKPAPYHVTRRSGRRSQLILPRLPIDRAGPGREGRGGVAWRGVAWPGLACPGMTWRGMAWHVMSWHGMAWHDMTWRDVT